VRKERVPFFHELLQRLIFSTANDPISIGKDVIIDDADQTSIIELLQYFKQAVPFSSRELANKVVNFYGCHMRAEMDAAILGKMLMVCFLCTGIFVQWVPPLPSNSLV